MFADPDVSHVDGEVSPGARHRDDRHRADPGRPADAGEGGAAAGQGGQIRQGSERGRGGDAAASRAALLDGGTTLFAGAAGAGIDLADLRELHLLTAKPFLYVFNVDEAELADKGCGTRLAALVAPAESVFLDAKTEAELAELRRG